MCEAGFKDLVLPLANAEDEQWQLMKFLTGSITQTVNKSG